MKKLVIAALEKIATRKAAFGAGAAGATYFLSSFFGISFVAHSSGGALLTAGSGYIAGTFVSALAITLLPFVIAASVLIMFRTRVMSGFDWSLRRLYHWRNKH